MADSPADPTRAVPAIPSVTDLETIQALAARFPWLFPGLDARATKTVGEVIDVYLKYCGDELSERTARMRRDELEAFRQTFGKELVASLTPLELKAWLKGKKTWAAANTRARVRAGVQRCFNWLAAMRIIRDNPLRGAALHEARRTGRNMRPEEYQALLRAADAPFKRFLVALRLTGARPGELSRLKWSMIDWEQGIATLAEHKTARKTGKPRTIVFPPNGMKLLAIIRRDHHGPAACELRRLLEGSPERRMKAKLVVAKMRALGYTYRRVYLARRAIGATLRRVGGWAAKGYTVYELPANPKPCPRQHDSEYVFLNSKHGRWKRYALGTKFNRLRKQLGLPMDCKLYGLRHTFITEAIRRGAGMKGVATLAGHADTRMLDQVYCHIDQDYGHLHNVVKQALGLPVPSHMPDKNGTKSEEPAPAGESMLAVLYRRIADLESQLKMAVPASAKPAKSAEPRAGKPLQPCQERAYRAAAWARQQNLSLKTDRAVYLWLLDQPEWKGQLPPTPLTFHRYLASARRHLDGASKREQRRKGFTPPPEGDSA